MSTERPTDPTVLSLSVPSTAYYSVAGPDTPGDTAPALLIALHGWGQNARKMLRDLAPLRGHNIVVAAAQAPHPFYLDMESGKVGFHWLTRYERDQAIADTNAYIATLIDTLHTSHPFDPQKVYLLGFSQGCSMAWRFCVSGVCEPAGMIACGADLPPDVAEKLPGRAPFRVLLVHGREDAIISNCKMHDAESALRTLGLAPDRHEFDGGHEIPREVVAQIAAWITRA